MVLALVRSEALTLVGYLRTELAPRVSLRRHQGAALRASKDLSRLAEEIGRRLRQEADDADRVLDIAASAAEQLRAQVVRLAAAVEARLPADESFTRLVSPVVLAQRLRNDLWVFAQLARAADEALGAASEQAVQALDALGAFLSYFQDVSYQLLRYGDLQAFDQFAAILREAGAIPTGPMARARLARGVPGIRGGRRGLLRRRGTPRRRGRPPVRRGPRPGRAGAFPAGVEKYPVWSRTAEKSHRTDTCVVACLLVKSTAVATLRHAGGSRQPCTTSVPDRCPSLRAHERRVIPSADPRAAGHDAWGGAAHGRAGDADAPARARPTTASSFTGWTCPALRASRPPLRTWWTPRSRRTSAPPRRGWARWSTCSRR